MREHAVTWQGLLTYRKMAKAASGAIPHSSEFATILPFLGFQVIEVRNWIHQTVGPDYELWGLFNKLNAAPEYIKTVFLSEDVNMLFALTFI